MHNTPGVLPGFFIAITFVYIGSFRRRYIISLYRLQLAERFILLHRRAMVRGVKLYKMVGRNLMTMDKKRVITKVNVSERGDIFIIEKIYKLDGKEVEPEKMILSYREATAAAIAILAAFPEDTAELIKGMYNNYSNETDKK